MHVCGRSKGNFGILLLQSVRGQSVCHSEQCFLRERVSQKIENRQKVYLEEVQDELMGQDSTSDANVAEQVEIPVAREAPPQPRRSTRIREARGEVLLLDHDEPATDVKAMMDPDSKEWQIVKRSKIDSMRDNQVWNLVDPSDGVKAIECKWIYKKKRDMDGNVHVYKARLVANGF